MRAWRVLTGAAFAALLTLWAPAHAQDEAIARTEATLTAFASAAASLEAEASARGRIAALTEALQAFEAALGDLRAAQRGILAAETEIEERLRQTEAITSAQISVMLRVAATPAPTGLLHPDGPVASAQASALAAAMTNNMLRDSHSLADDLAALASLRATAIATQAALEDGLTSAQSARAALATAVSERRETAGLDAQIAEEIAVLGRGAETLAGFLEALGGIDTPGIGVSRPATGAIPLPVSGDLVLGFGETDAAGISRSGLLLATSPGAVVVAPADATVRYTGQLLDYGNIVILEPYQDVMIILAGLGQTFATAGEILPAGQPIGLMPSDPAASDAILTENSGQTGSLGQETLYIEVRDGQEPVDPATIFALDEE